MKQQLTKAAVKLGAFAIVAKILVLAIYGIVFVNDGVWSRNYEEVQAGAAVLAVLILVWIAIALYLRLRTVEDDDDDGDEDELEPDFIPPSVKPSKSNELQLWN